MAREKKLKLGISAKCSLLKYIKVLGNSSHRSFLVFFLINVFYAFVWFINISLVPSETYFHSV